MDQKFIHLRVHTNYSVGESSLHIANIAKLCKELKYPAIAMSDTNNLYGAREFSYKLSIEGIQPIVGFEMNVSLVFSNHKLNGSIVLLAKNLNGYKNMLKIHKDAYFYKNQNNLENPEISYGQLLEHLDDVVILSAGIDGFLHACINQLQSEDVENIVLSFKKYDFYLELNRFGTKKDFELEEKLLRMAIKYDIPIVATNNVYFARKEDFGATDILSCIRQGALVSDENRKLTYKEAYFKSQNEMIELFADIPEAIENTINIAKKCCFFVEKQPLSLPKFSENEEQELAEQASLGLKTRLEEEVYAREVEKTKEELDNLYFSRLNFEIDVINKMGFCGYFLIVSDFIKWAKNNDIPVGPGRGSGAGSLVAWALFITDVNPIQFNLLFERFLNPERVSMPDFDIDFCQNRRDEVVNYVVNKYGADRVAHIITFGTLQPRAAIKDVGRVMGLSYSEVDSISKKIPYTPPSVPLNLTKIINEVEPLKQEIQSKEHVKYLFEVALKLEGLYRNISTHAAGVVISKVPLQEVVPLYYDSDSTLPSVGFSMKYIEDVGLVKFDFLALKTLTVMQNSLRLIKQKENIDLNLLKIEYQDIKISELLANGNTLGVFQLESRGMTDTIKQLKPDNIEDIIAIISLYRPGPMENIPMYINRKHGKENIEYIHPKMQSILDETFGIMIYQEQVMQMSQIISGYTLGGADILRRAMGKKDPKEMSKQKDIFTDGALQHNNIDLATSTLIFDQMEKFAGYGFNKSHATAYALISWQSAYLKAYYPCEFLTSAMSADIGNNNKEQQKFLEYVEEAKKFNIDTLPPCINSPCLDFMVEKMDNKKYIRYSLLSLKGMGENLVKNLIKEVEEKGKFSSIVDFLQRVDSKNLNKRYLESLIKAGALDVLHGNRNELLQNVDAILSYNNNFFANKNSNQFGLFDDQTQDNQTTLKLIPAKAFTKKEALAEELEIVGCFLSGHPLSDYKQIIEKQQVKSYLEVIDDKINNAYLAGYLMKVKITKSKTGTNYASMTFYDFASVFNIILIGDTYNKFHNKLQEGNLYILKTNIKIDEEEVKMFVVNLEELNNDYKVKKTNTTQVVQDYKIEKTLNYTIILNNHNDLKVFSDILYPSSIIKKDSLKLSVLNPQTKEYINFGIENLAIIESKINHIKSMGLDIVIEEN